MKRFLAFAVILMIIVSLTGCASPETESASRIVRPQVNSAPLQGMWLVHECLDRAPGAPQASKADKLMGLNVGFSTDSMVFGDYIWNDVVYKMKKVNTEEYFLHRFNDAVEQLGIKDKEVYVIQVSSGEKFLYEFVKIDNERIAVNIDSNIYCLKKTSPEFNIDSSKFVEAQDADVILNGEDASKELHSGILLGMRIPQKGVPSENGGITQEYRYQTYWIAFSNGGLRPVLVTPDIFLPRKDGFWRVKARKSTDSIAATDVIFASRVYSNAASSILRDNSRNYYNNAQSLRSRAILYVGNDYICFEDTYYAIDKNNQQTVVKKELRTLPIDRMDDIQGVRLSDIAGENGEMAIDEALADLMKSSKNSGIKDIDDSTLEQNFALFRKTGHWFFKGRFNFGKDYPVPFTDFNLNVLPPSDMVAYDTLHVPWSNILDRIPQAIDAYTSPNKDVSLVLTRSSLMIYAINGSSISDVPLAKLSIPEGGTVVMAEWGTGNYMKNWEKVFVENNPVKEAN